LPRDKIQILTKYGLRWDTRDGEFYFKSKDNDGNPINVNKFASPKSVIKECEDSLRRLGTDYIDLYQIHWYDPNTPLSETMGTINKLIDEGKVRYAGVCNYDKSMMIEAEKYISLVSDQVPYSMVRRDIEEELVPYLIEKKKSVLAYSPLQLGLLTGKMKPGYKFSEGDHRSELHYFKDENIKRTNTFLEKIKTIADEKKATLAQLVIAWTIAQPGITIALVGARNPKQALENAEAADIKLNNEEINFISSELEKLELVK
jgi:aryl-alcohol dehydrogenase-like predicted oxidoreductase